MERSVPVPLPNLNNMASLVAKLHDGFHVVVDTLNEARRTLGILVRVFGLPYRVRFRIPMPVTLSSRLLHTDGKVQH